MRRKDREVTDQAEIRKLLDRTMILHLALFDGDFPYIVPLHYGYEEIDGQVVFYMHCAREGHKLDLIRTNGHACVEIENDIQLVSGGDVPCSYGSTFSSVIARGQVEVVQDAARKVHALNILMKHQTGRDFEMNEQMAASVEVLQFTAAELTAKARVLK